MPPFKTSFSFENDVDVWSQMKKAKGGPGYEIFYAF